MLRDDGTDRGDGCRTSRNVLGEPLAICSIKPMTGFYRDGCCDTGREDVGSHTVCAVMTSEFLEFSKSRGNDLSTPVPEFGFPGLKPGDRWCLRAPRWQEAFEANQAPRVVLRDLEHFHPARPVLGAQSGERLGDEVIALCLHVEESRRHEHPHRALSSSNAVPPPARSDPQPEPHSEPVDIAPRSSSPPFANSRQRAIRCRISTPAQPQYPAASVRDYCSGVLMPYATNSDGNSDGKITLPVWISRIDLVSAGNTARDPKHALHFVQCQT